MVSHSGALGIALVHSGRLGVSFAVSAGNGAATDMHDYLAFLAGHAETRVALLVLERISDPGQFRAAVRAMHRAGKRVIALRVGRSQAGAAASAAHTGAMAGNGAAYAAFFRETGVVEVNTLDEAIAVASLLSRFPSPAAGGVALVGVSGGAMAYAGDHAERAGLCLPALGEATTARLRACLPPFATPQNPLDITGIVFAQPAIYREVLQALVADPAVGAVVAVQDIPAGLDAGGVDEYRDFCAAIASEAAGAGKPIVLMSNLAAGLHPSLADALEEDSLLVLSGTESGMRALSAFFRPLPTPTEDGLHEAIGLRPEWREMLRQETHWSESRAKAFLADHGIAVPEERVVHSAADAAAAAGELGPPVAMKIVSPDLAHKSDVGGVRLDIPTSEAAAEAYEAIVASVSREAPQERIEGVAVSAMCPPGIEAVVGINRDATFGLTVTVGLGGALVELMSDVAVAVLPVGRAEAMRMIARHASRRAAERGARSGTRRPRRAGRSDRLALRRGMGLPGRVGKPRGEPREGSGKGTGRAGARRACRPQAERG